MVSCPALGTDAFIVLAVLSGTVFLLLYAARSLQKIAKRLFEAQQKVPYHSGGGFFPLLLEKLSAALKFTAYILVFVFIAVILMYFCR
ncbi:hypothetical protein IJT93_02610 [bacterium]|nr:hypothetical protein [bacterium]